VRPRYRGVSHEIAFVASVGAGVLLVDTTTTTRATVAATIFAVSVSLMFAASALYHRINWPSRRQRQLFAKLDHAAIYLLISGTYTPFGLIVLHGAWRPAVLGTVWTGAGLAIILKLFWGEAPKWVPATIGLALGWIAVIALPELIRIGWSGSSLLLAGGLSYTGGAIIYARRRPDPNPAVFGYHEIFHLLVILAVACQYAAIAFYVLPRA
jgi:hemolysin III